MIVGWIIDVQRSGGAVGCEGSWMGRYQSSEPETKPERKGSTSQLWLDACQPSSREVNVLRAPFKSDLRVE